MTPPICYGAGKFRPWLGIYFQVKHTHIAISTIGNKQKGRKNNLKVTEIICVRTDRDETRILRIGVTVTWIYFKYSANEICFLI